MYTYLCSIVILDITDISITCIQYNDELLLFSTYSASIFCWYHYLVKKQCKHLVCMINDKLMIAEEYKYITRMYPHDC